MAYTVSQLAKISGVTPRTLHHYDAIGLLKPGRTRRNEYREYGETELLRLQQILFFRELGFPLDTIAQMIDSPSFNIEEALRDQQHALTLQADRLKKLITTITKTLQRVKGEKTMTDTDLYGGFTKEETEKYQAEAKAKWGHTTAWQQSQQRTKSWSKEDFKRVTDEHGEVCAAMVAVMDQGVDSLAVQALVAKHWANINQFYDVTPEIYRGLAQMYVADSRFAATYRKFHPDFPEFLSKAMLAYVGQQEKTK